MEDADADRFATAVAATLDGVAHLFREVDRLNESLLRTLLSEPTPFVFIAGTLLDRNLRRDRLERRIRDQYHFLLQPGADDEGLDDDVAEEEETDEGDEPALALPGSDRIRRHRGLARIDPSVPHLAVSVILHEPARPEQHPYVRYAVISGWGIGPHARSPKDGEVKLSQWMAVRMLRSLSVADGTDLSRPVMTRAKVHGKGGKAGEAMIGVRLASAPQAVPLFELQGIGAVEQLAQAIKAYWAKAAGDQTAGR